MSFDFDNFINAPNQAIFGRPVQYIPASETIASFNIRGDFHKSYIDVKLKTITEAEISSSQIVLFVREIDFPDDYKQPLQGDYVIIDEAKYQIVDIEPHIPKSKKLVLHEA
ncbi:MAG: hypothetical protein R3Y43_01450 [Alphaproteobacteria bacterium]